MKTLRSHACRFKEIQQASQIRLLSAASEESTPAGILGYEEAQCDTPDRSNEATAVLVHGLLGSGRNWRGFSKELANDLAKQSKRPWRFLLVDQRCHGKSNGLRGFAPPGTISTSAGDVGRFLDWKLGSSQADALLGHSLGGKVVMELLTKRRANPPAKQAYVLDSVAGSSKSGRDEPTDVKRVLQVVEKIRLPIESRDWLYQYLEARGFSAGFRLWMGSNLTYTKGGYGWTFNIKCAQQLYESYQESSFWDLLNSPPENVKLNLVRAANSDRWTKKHWEDLEKCAEISDGRIALHILQDAGHWLHADNPRGLRKLLADQICHNMSQ